MYYADADFENGSRFMFFIKNISDTDIAKTTSSSETLYMICVFTRGYTAGEFCTFSIQDEFMSGRFCEKLRLSNSDADELQTWIENYKDEIIAKA